MINNGSLNIERIFDQSFAEITFKMTGIEVKKQDRFWLSADSGCTFIIKTRGEFKATILVEFEKRLIQKIAQNILKKDHELSEQEQTFYVEEYLNIICGRAISEINNLTGKRSRISVVVLQGEIEEQELFNQTLDISYVSNEGNFNVNINYEEYEWGLQGGK